jgi:hypothetical protein
VPSTGSGGVSTTGGISASGGAVATGGGPASGGAVTSGGNASGGASAGAATTGGAVNPAGGAAGGVSNPTGGASNVGGTAGGGGTPAAGAAGAQGGSGGGNPANPCDGALFCDDFEAHDAGKAPGGDWTARVDGGAVSVDEAQHRSGAKSVKFTTEGKAGTKTAFIRLKSESVFPVAGNHFYGRMMFWLDAAPTAAVHWTILQSTGTVPGQDYRAQYRYGGQHPVMQNGAFAGSQLMANYETPDSYSGTGPSTDCWHHADQVVLPVGKWSCIEWEFDGTGNAMRFWLDSQPVASLTVVGTGQGCVSQSEGYVWTAPTFSELEIGWESYQEDAARTAYVDDLVLSTAPIGCPP